ncbi:MAG: ribokinase [Thermoguttaceae bacterium]|jgi:ribokinase
MKKPRIVVVGSVNADMVIKSRRIPAPGETVTGGEFVMAAGGKGANQAVAAARLGAEVTLVAKVGQDALGDAAIEGYRKEGIRTDCIFRDPQQPTGVALIMVDQQGENLISVASGANHCLSPAEVDRAREFLRAADMLLVQLEIPMETVCHAAALAAEAGVPVMLNPAPAAPLDDRLLRLVTWLTPNESETQRLTGLAVADEASAALAAARLLAGGVRQVVVTLGARGALLCHAGGATMIPGYRVEAVDSTAAGDAFNGALACALARGQSGEEAVRQAHLAAAFSVTRLGAQPSLPTAEQLQQFQSRVEG